MSQEIYPVSQRHCFTCIQWDGTRSYDHENAKVKVDAGILGTCRVNHQKVKGSHCCDNYFPLR